MARSIRKKIKETEKDLKKRFKKSGLSRREARKTARSTAKDVYEAERQEELAKNEANRQANRAAREAFFQKNRENEAMLKEQSRKAEEERLKQRPPQNQRPKSSNIATDLTKVSRGGIKGTASYNEQRKLYQDRVDQNQEAKRKAIESGAETFKTINPKTGEERNSRIKPKAKDGSALAIMIAPVKTKKMKAVKKGAKAQDGGKVTDPKKGNKKISEMSDKQLADMMKRVQERHSRGDINAFSADSLKRGRKELMKRVSKKADEMKKMKDGGSLKAVPSDNKGLGKLPKEVRNKMGYMKNGGMFSKRKRKKQEMADAERRKATQEKINAEAKKLQKESLKKSKSLSVTKIPKLKSSRTADKLFAKEGIAEKVTSGPQLVKYYMSKAGGGMSREQALAKMVRAKTGKIPSDDGKSMVEQPKMVYGGAMKKAMYGAKMKKKAMYGAKRGYKKKHYYTKK